MIRNSAMVTDTIHALIEKETMSTITRVLQTFLLWVVSYSQEQGILN